MDKKLIKHKNRYKSCAIEVEALKALKSSFIAGLHYTYQTKDDVCLVLDLMVGGTLGFLMHSKKRVPEKYVIFFTACIVLGYECLHESGFVYRDMKVGPFPCRASTRLRRRLRAHSRPTSCSRQTDTAASLILV